MLLKQNSLGLILVAHAIICATAYVIEDGRSPPQILKTWVDGKHFKSLKGRLPTGSSTRRANRRISNRPVPQQHRPFYFDSFSPKRPRTTVFNIRSSRQAQPRQFNHASPHFEQFQGRQVKQGSPHFQKIQGRQVNQGSPHFQKIQERQVNQRSPHFQQFQGKQVNQGSPHFKQFQRRPGNENPFILQQSHERHHERHLPEHEIQFYRDSSLFQQDHEQNSELASRYPSKNRSPFEEHRVIDARSPISKQERGTNTHGYDPYPREHDTKNHGYDPYLREHDTKNYGYDPRHEHEEISFGGAGIWDDTHQVNKPRPSHSGDFKQTLNHKEHSKTVQHERDHFTLKQNRGNNHKFGDYGPAFPVGETDYSHDIPFKGNEKEIPYVSPFSDDGAPKDPIHDYFDFFSKKEELYDYRQHYSLELESDKKTNVKRAPDYEEDFTDYLDYPAEEHHLEEEVTHKFTEKRELSQGKLESLEKKNDDKLTTTTRRNPVRSLEALESQEFDDHKIETIYRVSKGSDNEGVYPVITSVRSTIEKYETPSTEERNDRESSQPRGDTKSFEVAVNEEYIEPRSKTRRNRGEGVRRVGELPTYASKVENIHNVNRRISRDIGNNHVLDYIKDSPKEVYKTGVPTQTPKVYHGQQAVVVENPPELHQTFEVHHQTVPHKPDQSIVSIKTQPEAFVDIPQFVPGIHDLSHLLDSYQPRESPFLEVNVPKNVKISKIRKGFIYELHLTEEEHLSPHNNPFHQPLGHY